MIIRNLPLLAFIVFSQLAYAQFWGVNSESEFTNEATVVATDANGNSYVSGYITGQTAFGANNVMTNALGNGDVYVAKYNTIGTLLWTKHFSGPLSDRPFGLKVDSNGDVVVAGYFAGQLTFDGITLNSVNNSRDIFITKLDANGNVLWAQRDGGTGIENVYSLAIDNQDNIIITGQFKGNTEIGGQIYQSVFDPVNNTFSFDLFIAKYDPSGLPIWSTRSEAPYEERGLSVSTDSQNNIFVSGQFSDTMIFAGQQFNNNGYNVGFVAKLTSGGQLEWFNTLKAGLVIPYDLAVSSSDEVIVVGDYRGTLYHTSSFGTSMLVNSYQEKVFAYKISNAGEEIWKNAQGSDNEFSARAVDIDDSKNIFIVGHFKCAITELQAPATAFYNSAGGRDVFLWNISDDGANMVTRQMGSKLDDYAYSVAMKGTNDPLICGSYSMDIHIPINNSATIVANNQSNFNFTSGTGGAQGTHLNGDASVNSFLTNGINSASPRYNYFISPTNDSLTGFILPQVDTLHICASSSISYAPFTFSNSGPGYNYTWNNGETTNSILVETSGTYSVEVERWDGCSSNIDTLEVVYHPAPSFPLISDSMGIQLLNNIPYDSYTLCYPDSVYIWFSDLDTALSFSVYGPGIPISDTLPHLYTNEGTYSVEISNQFCTVNETFSLEFDEIVPLDIDPFMVMEAGDSLTLCEGENAVIQILDAITNPDSLFGQSPTTPVYSFSWDISGPGQIGGTSNMYSRVFSPSASGWYTFDYELTVGYDNTCGIDTFTYVLSEMYYFEVLPSPNQQVFISGDLLCPDGSVYLHIPQTIDGLSWSGPGIAWISAQGDSIQATVAGTYAYQGIQTDTISGCTSTSNFTYTLIEKTPPTIIMDPSDGIVCPFDSVEMWVNDIYVSYEWSGPSGMGLSFSNDHFDEELGFYYCTVVDTDGCYLTSPPAELREYSSPYLSIEPTNVICEGESVTILANFNIGSGMVDWAAPLVGNNTSYTVNQPGWYVAELTSCNITVVDSVEVINGAFTLPIQAADSALCFGDTITIQAPAGLSFYEWSNGEIGVNTIDVSAPGNYSLSAVNNFGCEAVSNTIPISFYAASSPPSSDSIVICNPGVLILENNSGFSTNWYSEDSLLQQTGNIIQLPVTNDTLIFLAHNQNDCPLSFGEILITVIPELPDTLEIQGPISLCANDSALFYIPSTNENIQWFINGLEISNDLYVYLQGTDLDGYLLEAVVSNSCHSDTLTHQVTIFTPESITLPDDSIHVCAGTPLELSIQESTGSLTWTGLNITSTADTLSLISGFSSGYIVVQGTDTNGCATNSDSTFIHILNVDINLESDISGTCENDTLTLWITPDLDSAVWTTPSQTFYGSEITVTLNEINDGWYYVYTLDSLGCSFNDSIEINSSPNSYVPLFWDSILCEGTFIPAHVYVDSIYTGPNSVVILAEQEVVASGWYYYLIENSFGCSYEDSVYIDAYDCSLQFPNVVTANNDGSNDFYTIPSAEYEPNNLFIVTNRWGQTVFEQSGYKNTFSGIDLSPSTYFYVYYPDYENKPVINYSGFFHLIKD